MSSAWWLFVGMVVTGSLLVLVMGAGVPSLDEVQKLVEQSQGRSNSNEVVKWCEKGSSRSLYARRDAALPGYEQCGEVLAENCVKSADGNCEASSIERASRGTFNSENHTTTNKIRRSLREFTNKLFGDKA